MIDRREAQYPGGPSDGQCFVQQKSVREAAASNSDSDGNTIIHVILGSIGNCRDGDFDVVSLVKTRS